MFKTLIRGFFLLLLPALLAGCTPQGKPQTFEVGNRTFLLDGKPFVIKAAEMHYTRIPAPYWVCLYVFWNIHETRP